MSQLDSNKSLVDQCVQGEGMVQINLEVKSQPGVKPKINILDILKTAEDEAEEKYGEDKKINFFFFSSFFALLVLLGKNILKKSKTYNMYMV